LSTLEQKPIWPEELYLVWANKIAKGEKTITNAAMALELERTTLWHRLRKRGLPTTRKGFGKEPSELAYKIYKLSCIGLSNLEIAERLGKSPRNVSVIKSKVNKKIRIQIAAEKAPAEQIAVEEYYSARLQTPHMLRRL